MTKTQSTAALLPIVSGHYFGKTFLKAVLLDMNTEEAEATVRVLHGAGGLVGQEVRVPLSAIKMEPYVLHIQGNGDESVEQVGA